MDTQQIDVMVADASHEVYVEMCIRDRHTSRGADSSPQGK